jgi:hypothetical protein
LKGREDSKQRGFPGTIWAKQGKAGSRPNGKRHILKNAIKPVGFGKIRDLDGAHG